MEKRQENVHEQHGNTNKEVENLKRNQKNSGPEEYNNWNEKNLLEGFRGRFEQAKERISKLEGKRMEIIEWGTENKNLWSPEDRGPMYAKC